MKSPSFILFLVATCCADTFWLGHYDYNQGDKKGSFALIRNELYKRGDGKCYLNDINKAPGFAYTDTAETNFCKDPLPTNNMTDKATWYPPNSPNGCKDALKLDGNGKKCNTFSPHIRDGQFYADIISAREEKDSKTNKYKTYGRCVNRRKDNRGGLLDAFDCSGGQPGQVNNLAENTPLVECILYDRGWGTKQCNTPSVSSRPPIIRTGAVMPQITASINSTSR